MFTFCLHYLHVCIYICGAHMLQHTWRGRRRVCGSPFSPPTVKTPGCQAWQQVRCLYLLRSQPGLLRVERLQHGISLNLRPPVKHSPWSAEVPRRLSWKGALKWILQRLLSRDPHRQTDRHIYKQTFYIYISSNTYNICIYIIYVIPGIKTRALSHWVTPEVPVFYMITLVPIQHIQVHLLTYNV